MACEGLSVSSDAKNLGHVVNVKRRPDDKGQSIGVDVGRFLGLGTKVVEIGADKLEEVVTFANGQSQDAARSPM